MSQPIQNDRIARFAEKIGAEAETVDELCQRVTGGETLVEVCKEWDLPYSRIASWLEADADRWAAYERALKLRSDAWVAETVSISDGARAELIEHTRKDGTTIVVPVLPDHQRDRLRVDARFRAAAKYDRARFGGEGEAPARPVKPIAEIALLEVARRQAWVFEKAKRILQGREQPREPRLLEGKAETVVDPAPEIPDDGEI